MPDAAPTVQEILVEPVIDWSFRSASQAERDPFEFERYPLESSSSS